MFVCEDVTNTWRIAPLFQKQSKSQILIADPLEVTLHSPHSTHPLSVCVLNNCTSVHCVGMSLEVLELFYHHRI